LEKRVFLFDPKDRTVKDIDFYCKFEGHTGTAYFTHLTISQEESKQYVSNPSFESKDSQVETLAAEWKPLEGSNGYKTNFKDHVGYGLTCIALVNNTVEETSGAKQVVPSSKHLTQTAGGLKSKKSASCDTCRL
jgi:hypothetical protein